MKLALHRSITFWSGLLVMGFICWAWWLSYHSSQYAGKGFWTVGNLSGSIIVNRYQYSPSSTPAPWHAGVEPVEWSDHEKWFPACQYVDENWKNAGGVETFKGGNLPHWLILLAVSILWAALLFWRAKRRRQPPTP